MARSLLFGTSVSPGIAIGVLRFAHNVQTVEMRRISPREVEGEQEQLRAAVTNVRAALQEAMAKVPEDLSEYREVIAAQIELARDPKLVGSALSRIEKELVCAAWALDSTVEQLCSIFRNMDDPYLRDRAQDIRAVGLRLRECLAGSCALPAAAGAGILAAQDLSPADVMDMDFKDVRAVITAEGGPTSHTAILSRGLHIPALVGVTGLLETGKPGEKVIVDGLNGCLLLDPDADDLATYEERQREYQEWEARTRSESHWPAEMRDGVRVKTAMITADEFRDVFIKYLDEGKDVMYIACSSALSNSYKSSLMAHDILAKERPDGACCSRLAGKNPKHSKKQRTFEKRLVELRGMPRHKRAGMLEDHCPRQIGACGTPPEFTVDEVSDAPEHQSERHQRRNEVGHNQKTFFSDAGKNKNSQDGTDDAAVRTHAALPNLEDVQRMRQIPLGLIKETKPESTAQNNADYAVKQKVFHIGRRHLPPRFFGAHAPEQPEGGKPEEVHQPVPMNSYGPDGKSNGIEFRRKHTGRNENKSETLVVFQIAPLARRQSAETNAPYAHAL